MEFKCMKQNNSGQQKQVILKDLDQITITFRSDYMDNLGILRRISVRCDPRGVNQLTSSRRKE